MHRQWRWPGRRKEVATADGTVPDSRIGAAGTEFCIWQVTLSHARYPWLRRTVAETSLKGHGILLSGDSFCDELRWGVAAPAHRLSA